MSASRCLTAWNEPMGTPNCSRSSGVGAGDLEGPSGDADEQGGAQHGARQAQPGAAARPSPTARRRRGRSPPTGVSGSSGSSGSGAGEVGGGVGDHPVGAERRAARRCRRRARRPIEPPSTSLRRRRRPRPGARRRPVDERGGQDGPQHRAGRQVGAELLEHEGASTTPTEPLPPSRLGEQQPEHAEIGHLPPRRPVGPAALARGDGVEGEAVRAEAATVCCSSTCPSDPGGTPSTPSLPLPVEISRG